mmetsp:Transcript_6046/g.11982  ORF Transcript_6046/g.11982 Transcript_6046/m.11982 type:complete len:380 (-) Transcript_6046:258-1397(-)
MCLYLVATLTPVFYAMAKMSHKHPENSGHIIGTVVGVGALVVVGGLVGTFVTEADRWYMLSYVAALIFEVFGCSYGLYLVHRLIRLIDAHLASMPTSSKARTKRTERSNTSRLPQESVALTSKKSTTAMGRPSLKLWRGRESTKNGTPMSSDLFDLKKSAGDSPAGAEPSTYTSKHGRESLPPTESAGLVSWRKKPGSALKSTSAMLQSQKSCAEATSERKCLQSGSDARTLHKPDAQLHSGSSVHTPPKGSAARSPSGVREAEKVVKVDMTKKKKRMSERKMREMASRRASYESLRWKLELTFWGFLMTVVGAIAWCLALIPYLLVRQRTGIQHGIFIENEIVWWLATGVNSVHLLYAFLFGPSFGAFMQYWMPDTKV